MPRILRVVCDAVDRQHVGRRSRVDIMLCPRNGTSSLKLATILSSSRAFTSASDQKYPMRSWTHSKYETVTPPAFARMSGITNIPLSCSILSAFGRRRAVGPLGKDLALDPVGVLRRDLVLGRARCENVALDLQQVLVIDTCRRPDTPRAFCSSADTREPPEYRGRSGCICRRRHPRSR